MCGARQAAERDYDLNRAAELKYGTLLQLQRQLKEAEEKLAEKVRCVHSFCAGCFLSAVHPGHSFTVLYALAYSRAVATGLWMIACIEMSCRHAPEACCRLHVRAANKTRWATLCQSVRWGTWRRCRVRACCTRR